MRKVWVANAHRGRSPERWHNEGCHYLDQAANTSEKEITVLDKDKKGCDNCTDGRTIRELLKEEQVVA